MAFKACDNNHRFGHGRQHSIKQTQFERTVFNVSKPDIPKGRHLAIIDDLSGRKCQYFREPMALDIHCHDWQSLVHDCDKKSAMSVFLLSHAVVLLLVVRLHFGSLPARKDA